MCKIVYGCVHVERPLGVCRKDIAFVKKLKCFEFFIFLVFAFSCSQCQRRHDSKPLDEDVSEVRSNTRWESSVSGDPSHETW